MKALAITIIICANAIAISLITTKDTEPTPSYYSTSWGRTTLLVDRNTAEAWILMPGGPNQGLEWRPIPPPSKFSPDTEPTPPKPTTTASESAIQRTGASKDGGAFSSGTDLANWLAQEYGAGQKPEPQE